MSISEPLKFPCYAVVNLNFDSNKIPCVKVRKIVQELDTAKKLAAHIDKCVPHDKCVILKQKIAFDGGYFYDVSDPLNIDEM